MTGLGLGDAHRESAVRRLLTQIAAGPDPVLREMANGVLKGELSLREAAASPHYSDAIAGRFDTFWQRYQALSPDERDELVAEGHRFVELSPSRQSDPEDAAGS